MKKSSWTKKTHIFKKTSYLSVLTVDRPTGYLDFYFFLCYASVSVLFCYYWKGEKFMDEDDLDIAMDLFIEHDEEKEEQRASLIEDEDEDFFFDVSDDPYFLLLDWWGGSKSDLRRCQELYQRTVLALGGYPPHQAADAAFDAVVYLSLFCFARRNRCFLVKRRKVTGISIRKRILKVWWRGAFLFGVCITGISIR
jgi:hypothetical protein